MLDGKVRYKRIWSIAWPIILGGIAQNIVTVTDTAFLGRVGEIELGAAALGGIFYLTVVMLGWGFGIGTQIIVARRYGEGNRDQIGAVVQHALLFLVPVSVGLFLLMRSMGGKMLEAWVDSGEVYASTMSYLRYRYFGLFFAFVNMAFRALYIGIARTSIISWTTIIMGVVNVFFDYVLIFGKLGFSEMGIEGAAIASVLAELTAMLSFILHTALQPSMRKCRIFSFAGFDRGLYFRIIRIASPLMFQHFFSIFVWFIFFLMVESLGERPLAISNIIRSMYMVLLLPVWGFASAANTLVSSLIGQGRREDVMKVTKRIVHLSFLSVFILALLNLVMPANAMRIFTNDSGLIQEAIPVFYVVVAGALGMSVSFVLFSAVSGTGKTMVSLFLESGALLLYLGYVWSVVNIMNGEVVHIWTSELVYSSLLGLLSWGYLRTGRWHKAKV